MESEIAAEIPEYSAPSLHVDETENVLNRKDELFKENLSNNENNLTFLHAVVVRGQIVPSVYDTGYPEKEVNESNGYSTVPQASEPMDCLEEPEHILKQNEMNMDNFISEPEGSIRGFDQFNTSPMEMNITCESEKHEHVKTFHWPPIGLKDQNYQITKPPEPADTFELFKNEESNDNRIAAVKPVPLTTTVTSSNYVDQSETNRSQEENKSLISILKKEDNQAKKNTTVHFPENIVSVKFYDISEDEDSDNDTVILSDPEEDDDFRDQEVPLDTYDDYITNPCFPGVNFIPQFSFPPVLKIANHQLYDDIDDEEDQILAIMEDDDGRGNQRLANVSDLPTDTSYHDHEESVSEFHDDQLTSKLPTDVSDHDYEESVSEFHDDHLTFKLPTDVSYSEESVSEFHDDQLTASSYPEEKVSELHDDQLTSEVTKKLAENPEDAMEMIELQTPKNGIEGLEDDSKDEAVEAKEGESESLVLKENASMEETSKRRIERQEIFSRGTAPLMTMLPEMKNPEFDAQHLDEMKDEFTVTQEPGVILLDKTLPMDATYGKEYALKHGKLCNNNPTACDFHANTNTENSVSVMIENVELLAEDKSEPALVSLESNVPAESSDPCTSRTFHGNCGSMFLWRGPRTINSMIVDENLDIPPVPTVDNDILYRSSLTKEEIAFPKVALVDVGSSELHMLAAVENKSAVAKHCQEDFKLEKYAIHSFISCPDYLSKFDETWESTELLNKMQKLENDTHNSGLKDSHLTSGIAENVEQRRTEFYDHDETELLHSTTFRDDNQGRKYTKEYDAVDCKEKRTADDGHHLTPQTVPDMDIQNQLKAEPAVQDYSRAVPYDSDDAMDTTNASLHLTDYPPQSHKLSSLSCEDQGQEEQDQQICSNFKLEEEENISINRTSVFKTNSGFSRSHAPFLAKQGKRKLRVGLSKSTRVKPLHPYWSKERIK